MSELLSAFIDLISFVKLAFLFLPFPVTIIIIVIVHFISIFQFPFTFQFTHFSPFEALLPWFYFLFLTLFLLNHLIFLCLKVSLIYFQFLIIFKVNFINLIMIEKFDVIVDLTAFILLIILFLAFQFAVIVIDSIHFTSIFRFPFPFRVLNFSLSKVLLPSFYSSLLANFFKQHLISLYL